MRSTHIFDNVFCIPHAGRYIVYFPLQRILLEGNAQFVNLLHLAQQGDKSAQDQLGIADFLAEGKPATKSERSDGSMCYQATPFAPTTVSLFLTTSCTLRCGYCYADGGATDSQMSWDMVTGILGEVVDHALTAGKKHIGVHFHGGGDLGAAWPLLVRTREHLRALEQRHSLKAITSIGINGVLGQKQCQWIIDNIDSATVSMDGPAEIQNRQRPLKNGGASFPFVRETLKTLDAAGFSYGLRTTVTAQSVTSLENIVSFFVSEFSVKEIKAEPMYPRGRASAADVPEPKVFVEQFRRAARVAERAGRRLSYSGARYDVVTDVFCQAAGDSCAVTPQGWVTSCYEVLDKDDPLAEVFLYGRYNPATRKLEIDEERRRKLRELSVWYKPYCEKCFCKWHCAGDCPVKAIQARQVQNGEMPARCYINRELTKDQLLRALDGAARADRDAPNATHNY